MAELKLLNMKVLKIIGILILIIFLTYKSCQLYYSNIPDSKDLEDRIERYLDNYYFTDSLSKGVVVGVVQRGKVFIKGFGRLKVDSPIKPDSMTLFEIGSITKVFTSEALKIGVSRGDFKLEDDIRQYLSPKVQLPSYINISLLNLSTHTSGLPRLPQSLLDKMKDSLNPYKDLVQQDIYDYLKSCNENKPVGQYGYSNLGVGLLGHILELKYQKKYDDIIQDEICSKLKMRYTFNHIPDSLLSKVAQGYNEFNQPNPLWDFPVFQGTGCLKSNVVDMIKFLKAHLNESETAISPTLIECFKPQMNGDTGLGWHLYEDDLKGIHGVPWHNGGTGGFRSFIAMDKNLQTGIILLSNSSVDITKVGMQLFILSRKVSLKN